MDNREVGFKSAKQGTILVVDDNKNNRDMCKIYLEMEGYKTHTAENGEQGIEKAREIQPDLMLLDIMMPVMDGHQTLTKLKSDPDLRSLPVLVLTVKSDAADVVKALRLGAHDYLKKPFDVDELVARVHTLVTLKQTQDSLRRLTSELRSYQSELETEMNRKIHEAKAYQDKIFQNQKLEALGTLASGIAHDFKNILFLITGYIEMTLMNISDDCESARNLEQAMIAAKRAKNLIDNIQAFGRPENSEWKPTNIQHMVIDIIKMMRSSIPPSIHIEQDIDMACGVVMCAPGQIHQMVVNLCTNAYQAMRGNGGTLKIALKEIYLDSTAIVGQLDIPEGKYVELQVSDTGHGMPPDVLERIFDPYFSTKKDADGNGLGLSVVHGIVKNHNGDMAVSSGVGEGTIFRVYLPQMDCSFFDFDEDSQQSSYNVMTETNTLSP